MEMKRRKLVYPLLAGLIIIFSLAGCSENDPAPADTGLVNLSLAGSGSGIINTGGRTSGRTNAEVVINDFKISIRDVVFKTDNDDDGVADDSTEVLFRGPYSVDLMIENDALEQTIGNADVPIGNFTSFFF